MLIICGFVYLLFQNYEEKNTFIITKSPTDSTIAGFWSLIVEQNVKTVIMLTDPSATNYGVKLVFILYSLYIFLII